MNNNNMDQKMKNCKYTMMKFLYEAVYAICISKTSPFAICWKSSMKILGILLIMFFYALVIIILYSYFFDTCKIYYLVYRNSWLSGAMIILGIFLSYCITHNFTLAAFVGPGDTQYFKEYTEDDYDKLKRRLDNYNLNYCKKCQTFKPERAHHCSICEKCILKMDHHCPWINNCVGHNNHRYFLLMILYLQISLFYLLLTNIPLVFSDSFLAYKRERTGFFVFITTLTISLIIVLFFFNLWNWYLVIKGSTTIEFWGEKSQANNPQTAGPQGYHSSNYLQNLEMTFGTQSIWRILKPTFSKLQNDGIQWTKHTGDLERGGEDTVGVITSAK